MALIDKASLLMVPSTYEAGTLYNVLPSGNRAPDETGSHSGYDQTRADFTFDRGTNAAATRVNSDGLIEKYRENLYTQSNNFGHSDWNVKTGTFTQGVEDPDGGNNAWSWTATNTDPYLYQNKNLSGVHCLSIWVKGIGNTIGHNLEIRVGASINYVELTSEWQRVEAFAVLSGSVNIGFEYGNPAATSGDVIHIYQAQLETGLVATDYLDSGATTAKAGVLVDLPRINYDANGENGSLLLEPSRQQLLPYSEYFGDWQKNNNAVVELSDIDSPEGLKNAYEFTYDGTNNGRVEKSVSVTNGITYTFSIYLKNKDISDPTQVFIGLSTAPLQGEYVTITNEWQRFETTQVANGTVEYPRVSTNGSGTLYAYGAQLEAGSYATSYIPNHGTSGGVTRAADDCEISTLNSGILGTGKGSFYLEGYVNTLDGNGIIILTAGTSIQNLIYFWIRTSGTLQIEWYQGGGLQASLQTSADTLNVGDSFKIAAAYQDNDFVAYLNGVQIAFDTSGTAPNPTSLMLGQYTSGAYKGGALHKTIVFPSRLTNAELAALTA